MQFSGIDLHKRSLVIYTLDAEGATTRQAELRSNPGGRGAFARRKDLRLLGMHEASRYLGTT